MTASVPNAVQVVQGNSNRYVVAVHGRLRSAVFVEGEARVALRCRRLRACASRRIESNAPTLAL
jgi:hypothetical protein